MVVTIAVTGNLYGILKNVISKSHHFLVWQSATSVRNFFYSCSIFPEAEFLSFEILIKSVISGD